MPVPDTHTKSNMYADAKTWNPFKGCRFDCTYCVPSFQRQAKRQMHLCSKNLSENRRLRSSESWSRRFCVRGSRFVERRCVGWISASRNSDHNSWERF
jgi:hypothetical protein